MNRTLMPGIIKGYNYNIFINYKGNYNMYDNWWPSFLTA